MFAFLGPDGVEPDLSSLQSSDLIAADVEVAKNGTVLGVSVSNNPLTSYFFFNIEDVRKLLENAIVIFHNAKYDYKVLKQVGIRVSKFHDTMIAAHLLENPLLSLKDLALKYTGKEIASFEDVVGKKGDLAILNQTDLAAYSCPHAMFTFKLWSIFEKELHRLELWHLYHAVEIPLLSILAQMEEDGVKVDLDMLKQLDTEFAAKQEIFSSALDDYSPGTNFNSGDQVAEFLFDQLKLPPTKRTESGKRFSTAEEDIAEIDHPAIKLLLAYRGLGKLRSTYLKGLRKVADKHGRVHCNYSQVTVPTGRLACKSPNLQNIPVRDPLGKRIRKAFVAKEGCKLVVADWDQIELRDIADFSAEPVMIKVFNDPDGDIHATSSIDLFGTADRRRDGKTLNFCVSYGGGAETIATKAGIPLSEGKRWRSAYFTKYSVLSKWIQITQQDVQKIGFVRTKLGRIRSFPKLRTGNSRERQEALREAVNTIIQGSSAEIVKQAMIRIYPMLSMFDAKMLMQIHDELVFEVPEEEVEGFLALCKYVLPTRGEHVPFPVSIEVGDNWLDAH